MAILWSEPASNEITSADRKGVQEVITELTSNGLWSIPLNIEAALKYYGMRIFYEDMGDLSGYLEKRSTGWIAGVNTYQSEQRQRFTLAHELGHFCLHNHLISGSHKEKIFFRSAVTDHMEKEANEFASDLLIPKVALLEQIRSGNNKLSNLASYFNVSLDAMRYKAFRLKLISEY